jgi:hypothetical protein
MSIMVFVGTFIIVHVRVLVNTKDGKEVLFGEFEQIF